MRILKFNTAVLFALVFLLLTVTGLAQDTDEPIKVNTVLVNIPVIASDRQGRYVSGLKKENFSLTQDGEKQDIEFFADEKAPMNVVILIDVSASTQPFLANIKSAARDFIKIFRPEDQGMIVTFAGYWRILQGFTSDQAKLGKAIDNAEVSLTGSNMQDRMYYLVQTTFAEIKGRKAIIVLTDGDVAGKEVSNPELLDLVTESDVLIYPLLFRTDEVTLPGSLPASFRMSDGTTMTRDQFVGRIVERNKQQIQFMTALGTATGGRLVWNKSNNFKESFQNIADELKNQYIIGFYPPNADDGRPHKISLKVDSSEIVIRSKKNISLADPIDH